jgi:hypothetical protein
VPCEIRVEVVKGIDFLQVVNTTLYATTMNFSNNSSLKNNNSHIHTFLLFFCFSKLFISNSVDEGTSERVSLEEFSKEYGRCRRLLYQWDTCPQSHVLTVHILMIFTLSRCK